MVAGMAQISIRWKVLWMPAFAVLFLGVGMAYAGEEFFSALEGYLRPVLLAGLLLFLAYSVGMKTLRFLGIYLNDTFPLFAARQGKRGPTTQPLEGGEPAVEGLRGEILSWEKVCLALGLGLGALAYGTFLLALLKLLRLPWVLIGLGLAALCVPGEIRVVYRYFQLPADWRRRGENRRRTFRDPVRIALWVLIVIPVLLGFLSALAPPHQSDALRYHLAAPARYVAEGGWVYLRDSAFSNFPFTVEMLYTLALVFGEDVACRLIHFSFFGLTLLALYALGRRLHSSTAGLLAAAILACTPFVPLLASWAFIELGLTYYYLLTFYTLVLWVDKQFQRRRKKGWLGGYRLEVHANRLALLIGVFCGLAMGIKYTALFLFAYVAVVMVGVLAWRTRDIVRRIDRAVQAGEPPAEVAVGSKPCLGDLWSFAWAALIVAAPWYL
ncbi:MAG TPA: phospholipid carrier-dependent glycosyltransferase, partial [Firmicutes bacterium]|nr:phospholipid carrier-dependent glycosyltransferase [Bacillota bacterium]